MIGDPWRIVDGKWTVDRPVTQTDPLPPPPVPFNVEGINRPCTSYSRTIYNTKMATDGYDIAYTFTHNNIMLEHNAMNNMNTIAHMDVHNTQY